MDLVVLDEKQTPYALSALRAVVASNGTMTPAERRFIEVVGELHGIKVDVDSLPNVRPGEVAEVIAEAHQRKRVVQLAAIAAMVEGEVTPAGASSVRALAAELGVKEAGLKVLDDIAAEHRFMTRFDMMRRIMGRFGSEAYHDEGLAGVRKMLALFGGGGDDPEVAWKYKQLSLLPEGTLGREFWEHCTKNRFCVPGEKGGIPERMVFHDFGHVLAGYGNAARGRDPAGRVPGRLHPEGRLRVPDVRDHPVPPRREGDAGGRRLYGPVRRAQGPARRATRRRLQGGPERPLGPVRGGGRSGGAAPGRVRHPGLKRRFRGAAGWAARRR
jgi:hypothetical protein